MTNAKILINQYHHNKKKISNMSEICGNCGSIDSYKGKTEGGRSVILFILLLCCMIVPGLLYWGFAKKQRKFFVCKSCGAENQYFDLSTPKGKKLLNEYHPNETLPK